jgi:diguanylate cyclase (GGDEF)-like protein
MLLIEAANRLKSCIREVDSVARFGGDEFVVLLVGLDDDKAVATAQAAVVAGKIFATLSELYQFTINHEEQANATVEHHCTASIGVAVFNGSEGTQEDVMKWADAAMYEAKDAGRNQIVFYGERVELTG